MVKGILLKNDFGLTEERSFYYWGPILPSTFNRNKKLALNQPNVESYLESLLYHIYNDGAVHKWASDRVITYTQPVNSQKEIAKILKAKAQKAKSSPVEVNFSYLTPATQKDVFIQRTTYAMLEELNVKEGYFLTSKIGKTRKFYIDQVISLIDYKDLRTFGWAKLTFVPEKNKTRMFYKEESPRNRDYPWASSKRKRFMPDPTHVEEMRKEMINESPSFSPLRKLPEFKAIKRMHRPIANKTVKTQASPSANISPNVYHELAPVLEKMVKDTLKIDPTWSLQLMSPEGKRYSLKLEELED